MARRDGMLIKIGVTVFLTVAAILLFYDTLFGSRWVMTFGRQFIDAIAPILFGAFMAYLLAPAVNFFERILFGERAVKAQKYGRMPSKGIRAVSLLLIWILICVLLYLSAYVLLPELYKSVMQLFSNIETYYNTIVGWVERLVEENPTVGNWVVEKMNGYYAQGLAWLETDALPHAQALMGAVTGGVGRVLTFFENLLIGAIVSVYFLATKEQVAAHARKVVYSLFSKRNVRWVLRGVHKMDSIFSGFVRGKLLDSLIIGILCFIGCSLLKFPYTPLVSVIVGVTNVIPFFGPFLGAIPSTILILLVSPIQALYFVIFVLALQQLDGNLIGPLILGDKTGLSSLWVIIAILVGGSFFGLLGMFFGVPVCACLYSLATFLVERRLKQRALPINTEAYNQDIPRTIEVKVTPETWEEPAEETADEEKPMAREEEKPETGEEP